MCVCVWPCDTNTMHVCVWPCGANTMCALQCYLLLFGVELEALSEGAGLGLMVLLSVQIHTLSIRDVLFLSEPKQTAWKENHSQPIKSLNTLPPILTHNTKSDTI